jgi:hypothetical protein
MLMVLLDVLAKNQSRSATHDVDRANNVTHQALTSSDHELCWGHP